MPAFFGMEVRPGRRTPYVPPPEDLRLHVTGATLGADVRKGERVVLKVRVSEGEAEVFVCSFRGGTAEHCPLDLVLDEYAEFSIDGACSVHLVGYFMPEFGPEDEGDSEDEDEDEEWMEGESDDSYSEEDSMDGAELLQLEDIRSLHDCSSDEEDDEDDYSYDTEDYDSEDGEAPELVPIEDRPTIEEVFEEDEQEARKGGKKKGKAAGELGEDADGNLKLPQKRGAEELSGREVRAAKRLEGEGISNKKKEPKKEKPKTKQPKREKSKEEAASRGEGSQPQQPKKEKPPAKESARGKDKAQDEIRRYPNGFEVIVLTRGAPDGKVAKPGKRVQVRYTGRLKSNGKVFDKTKGGSTFSFRLGVGEVIQGWDVGVRGMRVGDKRRLTVPPDMGYGNQTQGPIPANSTLVFDVELVGVK